MDENVREIPLSQGKVALVDECDYERVSKFKWYASLSPDKKRWYARRACVDEKTGIKTMQSLHRFIMGESGKCDIDHKDGNGLNCQRNNLRKSTRSQNMMNCGKRRSNTSGFKGVSWGKSVNKWVAETRFNGKKIHIGCFSSLEDAARAYDKVAKSLYGEFVKLNFSDQKSGDDSLS